MGNALPAHQVLVTIGTPCTVSALGTTESAMARLLDDDTVDERFTVVAWDHNLAFGADPGDRPAIADGPPDLADGPPDLADGRPDLADGPPDVTGRPAGPDGSGGPGGPGGSNVLADADWAALVETRTEELRIELYDRGIADDVLAAWSDLVVSSGLVDDDTVAREAGVIADVIAS